LAVAGIVALSLFAEGPAGVGGWFVLVEDVRELGGVEDLAADLTLYKLDVLLAGDDANLGMFARSRHRWKTVELVEVCLRPNRLSIEKFALRSGIARERGLPRALTRAGKTGLRGGIGRHTLTRTNTVG
jgi:hypothetical protein